MPTFKTHATFAQWQWMRGSSQTVITTQLKWIQSIFQLVNGESNVLWLHAIEMRIQNKGLRSIWIILWRSEALKHYNEFLSLMTYARKFVRRLALTTVSSELHKINVSIVVAPCSSWGLVMTVSYLPHNYIATLSLFNYCVMQWQLLPNGIMIVSEYSHILDDWIIKWVSPI